MRAAALRTGLALIALALALALPAVAAAAVEYSLTITEAGTGEGRVECEVEEGLPEPCGGMTNYPAGTEVTLSAEAEEGSEFTGWEGGTGSAAACTGTAPCTFTIAANSSLTAVFDLEPPPEFSLVVTRSGTGSGTVECEVTIGVPEPCEGTSVYPEGTEVTLLAKAASNSEFGHWSGDCAEFEENEECTLTMDKAHSVTAAFRLQPALTVGMQGTGTGFVTCEAETGQEECAKRYPRETELILRAETGPNSEFVKWSGECDSVLGNECTILEMEKARTVTATFNLIPQRLSVTKSGTGTGTVRSSPGGISCGVTCSASFGQGTTVVLTGTPGSGSQAVRWSGCDSVDAEGRCVMAIGADRAVIATFDAKPAPPPEPPGTAGVAPRARVRGDHATLRLSCRGGPCKGTFKLTARLRPGARSVVIGKGSFDLSAGASKAIPVRLSAPARRVLKRRGALRTRLAGSGIAPARVRLLA